MAGAGFYAIQAARIRFGRDGRWYADDEPITNPRIAALFARHLRRQPDGTYAIQMADERAAVEIEDAPFVVVGVSRVDEGTWHVELNDGSMERLDPASVHVAPDAVAYCRVKGGRERARFLRAAYYELAQDIVETAPGRFVLSTGRASYPIVHH
jgi:hypothetical protein